MEDKNPKILISCPTSSHKEYCLKDYIKGIKELTYENFDVLFADNSENDEYMDKIKSLGFKVIKSPYSEFVKDRVIKARNLLREKFLEGDYDYFLSLEQDVIPPKNIIEGLLSHKKEIVSGIVYHLFPKDKSWQEKPMIAIKSTTQKGKLAFLSSEQIENVNAIVKIDYCSMGCLLISKQVLKKIKFRYEEYEDSNKDNPEDVKWDDMCFCKDAQNLNEIIYADLGAKCRHLVLGGYSVTLGDTSKVEIKSNEVSLKDIMKD
ncbi:MAG: hypothetical protein KJ767_01840 [Nanoarchaeota archaeon]|nr:hypothetical protein [Nanoarchaeota archaeon]